MVNVSGMEINGDSVTLAMQEHQNRPESKIALPRDADMQIQQKMRSLFHRIIKIAIAADTQDSASIDDAA